MQKESSVVRRLAIGPTGQMRNPPGIRTPNLLISLLGGIHNSFVRILAIQTYLSPILDYCTKVCTIIIIIIRLMLLAVTNAVEMRTRVAKVMRTDAHTWAIQPAVICRGSANQNKSPASTVSFEYQNTTFI